MASHFNQDAASEFGQKLSELHLLAGSPSFRSIARELILMGLGHEAPSDEKIRQMHAGHKDPSNLGVEELVALCRYYRVAPESMGPVVARRVKALEDLFLGHTGESDKEGTTVSLTKWYAENPWVLDAVTHLDNHLIIDLTDNLGPDLRLVGASGL